MGRKIVVTSGKGGVGKTTIVALFGLALSLKKQKVLLLDLDVSLNNLDVVLNIENKIIYDLADVLQGKCGPKQAVIQSYDYDNLYVLPSAHFTSCTDLDLNRLPDIVNELARDFDYVLIDCPAGVEKLFYVAIKCANEALVVVTPHVSSIRDADKIIGILRRKDMSNILMAVNRIRGDLVESKKILSYKDIEDLTHVPCVATIPEMDEINMSASLYFADYLNPKVFMPYRMLADSYIKDKTKLFDCGKKYRGPFGIIKRLIKAKI